MRLRDAPKDRAGRPVADPVYRSLIGAIASAELSHVDASRVLVIAAAARRESSASIRPLVYAAEKSFVKPRITVRGTPMLYEVALRPKFFLARPATDRLEILVHELWHASPRFDGTLEESRRHGSRETVIEEAVASIVARLPRSTHELAQELLEYEGELRLDAWLSRPPSREPIDSKARRDYDERDLYSSIIEQRGV